MIQQFITDHDAADGQVDGRAELLGFAVDFSVFDVNHNGVVDNLDALLVSQPGDLDADDDADLADSAELQSCFSGNGNPYGAIECGLVDLDGDGDVDSSDVRRFFELLNGPRGE